LPHKAFYFIANVLRIAPLLSLYHAMYIQRQYLTNGATYDQEVLYADAVPNAVLYLYNPDEVNPLSPHYIDYTAYYSSLFGLYLVGLITLVAQNVSVAGIQADWIVQHAAWKLNNESSGNEETEEATEEVPEEAAEEPAAEEPAF